MVLSEFLLLINANRSTHMRIPTHPTQSLVINIRQNVAVNVIMFLYCSMYRDSMSLLLAFVLHDTELKDNVLDNNEKTHFSTIKNVARTTTSMPT